MITTDRIYKQAFDGSLDAPSTARYKNARDYERNVANDETTAFVSGKKRLVFIAGLHISGRTEFVDFVEDVVKMVRPEVLLLEMPSDLSKEYVNGAKSGKSEVSFAIDLAQKYGAVPLPMDLARKDYYIPYMRHKDKDAIKAGILIDVIRTYGGLRRHYNTQLMGLSKNDIYDFAISETLRNIYYGWYGDFKNTFVKLVKQYNGPLIDRVKQINKEALKKFVKGKHTTVEALEMGNIQAPYPFAKEELNKIIRWQDAWRNKSMIDTCMKSLRKHDRVVALAGSGHIYECRAPLAEEMRKEFGKVKVSRWKELGSGKI